MTELALFVTNWQEKQNNAKENKGKKTEIWTVREHGTIFVHYFNVRNVRTCLCVISGIR